MKEYLEARQGQKLGITRAGMPKEVYFEATVVAVAASVVVLKDDSGREIALPLDKILVVGPAEKEPDADKVGFRP
jgi:hypothetical protein